MSKTVVQSFSAHLARFSPTRCVGIFPCCARGRLAAHCMGGERRFPSGGNVFSPISWAKNFFVLRTKTLFAVPSSFSPAEQQFFACCAGGSAICAPHFFFLVRKKKRVAPGAKKKEHPAALRCLGLLRIDGFLITERSAIWKFFRMRSTNSAAAAKLVINSQATGNVLFFTIRFVQQISFCPRSGSGKRKYTHANDAPKRKLKVIRYFY